MITITFKLPSKKYCLTWSFEKEKYTKLLDTEEEAIKTKNKLNEMLDKEYTTRDIVLKLDLIDAKALEDNES